MVLAVGAGFTMVGLFHLFTHAFFKALLFLAAGSVIHAVGTQDLFKMGGLRRAMPLTSAAFLVGALSLSGLPPFAGFFSKDDVLGSVLSQTASHPLYWPFFLLAFAAVFLTAYYIFRAWFLAFSGSKPRDSSLPAPHEGAVGDAGPAGIPLGPRGRRGAPRVRAGVRHLFLALDRPRAPAANLPPVYAGATSSSRRACRPGRVGDRRRLPALGERPGVLAPRRLTGPADPHAPREPLLLQGRLRLDRRERGLRPRAGERLRRPVRVRRRRPGLERVFAVLSDRLRRIQSGVVSDYAAYVAVGVIGLLLLLLFIAPWVATHLEADSPWRPSFP